ncbi:nucleoside triphosphate pyrophosphohydrolase [Megalodesulfovibrio gigas]|uniref:Putative nucleoside triphosphate pyrophosphohydrolase n=1 Tax=Megalodesulfovibrio gigas (strain ATCC 19364 / DSM 1382 / NCIMB 9332 / VKM B-1759) TaxID=1121448 RepID=T2GEZ5_MEGG1|nr:nucleoside triphosphate pyrophosphohydrolase [Megalodesulfovibrio gigas]AGW14744.1 putative nucleoside triphosphate pyrophosphohydrolase [Megalodesulfovibrio gigas DSM 1382 = ATCC 19364]
MDAFDNLRQVIARLLGPGGCPWDQEQTPPSLCDHLIEESYELVDAIRAGSADDAREELGDLFFLLCFIGACYEKQQDFTLEDSLQGIAAKMIRRHPHVFGDTEVRTQEELLRNWERIKRAEKTTEHGPAGLYDSLPPGLPPLLKAYRLHAKASRIGFTWPDTAAVEAKLQEEWSEFRQAVDQQDAAAMEQEFGDYLYTLVELGRRHGIKANAALDLANQRFLRRFQAMETLARERGLALDALSLAEQDALWNEIKTLE